jgi:hypothetical protein
MLSFDFLFFGFGAKCSKGGMMETCSCGWNSVQDKARRNDRDETRRERCHPQEGATQKEQLYGT